MKKMCYEFSDIIPPPNSMDSSLVQSYDIKMGLSFRFLPSQPDGNYGRLLVLVYLGIDCTFQYTLH